MPRFSNQKFYAFLISPMYATCSAHPFFLDLVTLIIFGDGTNYGAFLHPPVTSFLFGMEVEPNRIHHKNYIYYYS
jgi:hypothetical protein